MFEATDIDTTLPSVGLMRRIETLPELQQRIIEMT